MRLKEAIDRFDLLFPNALSYDVKRGLISRLDARVQGEVYENAALPETLPYDADTPGETLLVIPFPYDDLYLKYLSAETALLQGDEAKYNSFAAVFNAGYAAFAAFERRRRLPKKGAFLTLPEVTA